MEEELFIQNKKGCCLPVAINSWLYQHCAVNNNLIQESILVEPRGLKKCFIGSIPKPISSNMFWQKEATQFSPSLGFAFLWDSLSLEIKKHTPSLLQRNRFRTQTLMFQFLLNFSFLTHPLNLYLLGFWIQTSHTDAFFNLYLQEHLAILMWSQDYNYFMTNYCWNASLCCHMLALSLGKNHTHLLKLKVFGLETMPRARKKKIGSNTKLSL